MLFRSNSDVFSFCIFSRFASDTGYSARRLPHRREGGPSGDLEAHEQPRYSCYWLNRRYPKAVNNSKTNASSRYAVSVLTIALELTACGQSSTGKRFSLCHSSCCGAAELKPTRRHMLWKGGSDRSGSRQGSTLGR